VARRTEISIDRESVLAAAFALLQAEGLDGLTMRGLAARLSVQAPALYWYLGDKAELLGWMASAIYADARGAIPDATDWRAWLIGFGHALRRSFTAHRDGARLCAIAQPAKLGVRAVNPPRKTSPSSQRKLGSQENENTRDTHETPAFAGVTAGKGSDVTQDAPGPAADSRRAIAAPLLALGLSESQSLTFQASVISLTLGWASFQENGPMHDFLDTIMDFDAAFDIGLRALVRGYEAEALTGAPMAD
jgi:TetR/AcrR family tetracycline transcriptional repressor